MSLPHRSNLSILSAQFLKITKFMKMKSNLLILIIVVIIAIMSGLFYWYEWRPSKIRITCSERALKTTQKQNNLSIDDGEKVFDILFNACITGKGINK